MIETRLKLAEDYPTGFRMAQKFENDTAIDGRALADLASKPDKSVSEERILHLVEEIERWNLISDVTGLDAKISNVIIGKTIREMAKGWPSDRRFVELYERFLEWQFGPLRRVA